MTTNFDTAAINHMTVAIDKEMSRTPARRHADFDTIFLGGGHASEADLDALARFGLQTNWKVIYPVFDPADAMAGPLTFHVVVTDGLAETLYLTNGRLWKRDRKCPAMLLFANTGLVIRLNNKGRLVVRQLSGAYHDHGYELALEAIRTRASRQPGRTPVVTPVGDLVTVQDLDLFGAMLSAAV